MPFFKTTSGTAMLLAALACSLPAFAEEAPAAEAPAAMDQLTPAPSQADRMQLMQTMRARMQEIMNTQDQAKRQELIEAQAKDMDTMMKMGPGPGMGMGMMMGPGPMGKWQGQGANPNCKMAKGAGPGMMMGAGAGKPCPPGGKCATRNADLEVRVDALEKRMDMMQMMMKMMMRDE